MCSSDLAVAADFEPGVEVSRDGTVPVPIGAGIGVTVDWDRVRAATIETYEEKA